MKTRRLSRLCAAALAVFALTALPVAAQQSATVEIPLFGDTTLEVESYNGGARFVPIAATTEATGVTVKVAISGARPNQLPVQSTRVSKRVIVTIGRGSGATQLPFVAKNQVAYEVDYPARMKLVVHAFGGDIDVVDPTSAVSVTDASGDVLIENPRAPVAVDNQAGAVIVRRAVAALDLAADAGDITADLDPAWLPRSIRIESASGNLHLTVPANFKAKVEASSQSGSVHSALSPSAANASGPPVWLYAEHGDVTIAFPQPR